MVDKDKRAIRFTLGYCATACNALAWFLLTQLSPNQWNWILTVPIGIFCIIVGVLSFVAWMDS